MLNLMLHTLGFLNLCREVFGIDHNDYFDVLRKHQP